MATQKQPMSECNKTMKAKYLTDNDDTVVVMEGMYNHNVGFVIYFYKKNEGIYTIYTLRQDNLTRLYKTWNNSCVFKTVEAAESAILFYLRYSKLKFYK
jgi:predicted adenine nucleotide alpha hydrolase (AANH) superfamily ATPase